MHSFLLHSHFVNVCHVSIHCSFTHSVCNTQQHLNIQTYLTVIAVRCRIHLTTTVPANCLSQRVLNEILNESRLSQSTKKRSFDQLKKFWVSCLDIASQVPRQMCHWNNRLHTLNFVVLVSLGRKLILSPG